MPWIIPLRVLWGKELVRETDHFWVVLVKPPEITEALVRGI